MTRAARRPAAGPGPLRRLRPWPGWARGGAEDGTSTVEFVILFPIFMLLLASATESGVLMLRQAMLDRAMDIVIRELRLGLTENPTHDLIKAQLCTEALVIPDCLNSVLLELRPVSTETWSPLATELVCVDRSEEIQPVTSFTPGAMNEMMLVRACAKFEPIFPGAGLGMHLATDAAGDYALVAASAFVNEPG